MFGNSRKLEIESQHLTVASFDVSGHWTIETFLDGQRILANAQLTQHGATISGTIQFKLAALHPFHLSGVLADTRFVASYWRPHREGIGSGVLELRIDADGRELTGAASWFRGDGAAHESHDYRWFRSA